MTNEEKKKIYAAYHTHVQGSLSAFDRAFAISPGGKGANQAVGAARTCPHCRQTILASAAICPACHKHLRFEANWTAETLQVRADPPSPPIDRLVTSGRVRGGIALGWGGYRFGHLSRVRCHHAANVFPFDARVRDFCSNELDRANCVVVGGNRKGHRIGVRVGVTHRNDGDAQLN